MDRTDKKNKWLMTHSSYLSTHKPNQLSAITLTALKKKPFKGKPPYLKKPFCKAFYSLSQKGSSDTFALIKQKNPEFLQYLLHDLLLVEGYSETEVAFGLNIPLNIIREIIDGNFNNASREIFLAIVHLYARVFCGWCRFSES